jgi:hypothetical protein
MYINNDTTIVVSYLVYLLISITLTVWVARTLHKRGAFSWWMHSKAMLNWRPP